MNSSPEEYVQYQKGQWGRPLEGRCEGVAVTIWDLASWLSKHLVFDLAPCPSELEGDCLAGVESILYVLSAIESLK
jgi:hypothetical protein